MLPLEREFRAFAAAPEGAVEGALLVSRLVHPDTDVAWCRARLRALAAQVGPSPSAVALLDSLRMAGFRGAERYDDVGNSALELVLRTQRGIPISLAAVVIGVAEMLNLTPVGINFPGHFLVSLEGALSDPFTMTLIPPRERDERIAGSGVPAELALRPASPTDMVLRMLNNLRGLAGARADHALALELAEYQLMITTDALPVLLARADTWLALGAGLQAARELERALALTDHPALSARITERLREIAKQRRTLH
jgi:regulator of sirC expression with transglutaminase-like and TPR domain